MSSSSAAAAGPTPNTAAFPVPQSGVPASLTTSLESVSTELLERNLAPLVEPPASAFFTNWARTFECRPERVYAPTSAEQCRQILELARRLGKVVHPVGVGHSPSDLGCTNGWLVRMQGLKGAIEISHENETANFRAGTTLHAVHAALAGHAPAQALRNLGSISDQTIAGLISTASHGSGVRYPVVSEDVVSLLLVLPRPGAPVVRVSRRQDAALFRATQCGLGATGLILEVEMRIEPAYRLREVKEAHAAEHVLAHLDEIKGSAQHVRVWWYPEGGMVVARANRTYEPARPVRSWWGEFLGFHVTQFLLFVSRYVRPFTPYVGKWAWSLAKAGGTTVDDGYRVFNFDCLFPQYTAEYALPSSEAVPVLRALREYLAEMRKEGLYPHFPVEIRWSGPDDIPLSPSYGRETCWIGIVQYRPYGLAVPYRKFQAGFAKICAEHNGRPHWAKEHELGPKGIEAMYEKSGEWKDVAKRADPEGILRTEYLRRHFDGDDIPARLFKRRQ